MTNCRVLKAVPLTDKFGRAITDLRISVTDHCNYKCVYCRTGNEGALYGDLPFADYLRMARVLVGLGIQKVRITGGEPLLRKGVVEFVRELAKLRTSDGEALDIALTTNGHLLADMAQPLKDAGLSRVTVSMDAVDPDRFARITRVPNGYDNVLAGIRAARRAGLWPVKVNCVLMRGFNEDQIIPFGMFAREEGVIVRFIEFMPLEEGRIWSPATVVTLDEILQRMAEYRPAGGDSACPQRDRPPLPFRRRRRRDRHHRSRFASLLRPLQPHPHHLRRQDSHLPVFRLGPRPARPDAPRRVRRRTGGIHSRRDPEERRAPPHRRTGFRARVADHGAHRRMSGFVEGTRPPLSSPSFSLQYISSSFLSP